MVRRAPGAGDARVYDVSGQVSQSLSASLTIGAKASAAAARQRRKAALRMGDTELLHGFSFPTVATRVKPTRDGRYVVAAGTYPPQVHVYDTAELSLKFKRHVTSEIVTLQALGDDWRKLALLQADRYIDLHAQYGSHFKVRVPRAGRDMALLRGTAELFVCGRGRDAWRLDLEAGRFVAPVETVSGAGGGNNVVGVSPRNGLLAFGGDTGLVDVWDSRALGAGRRPAGTLDIGGALRSGGYDAARGTNGDFEVTAVRFQDNGVGFGVGTSSGHVLLFDLRSAVPTVVKDHGYDLPIRTVKMHADGVHVVSADAKSIKVWDGATGRNLVAVEPDADVNHVCLFGSSGVLCAAAEDARVRSYYVPALGPAPAWCSFLDSFTEELEDATVSAGAGGVAAEEEEHVYENYKFVARKDLDGLGLGNLVGTDMLKPYMHGFFVHMKLYRRAVDAASPFAYQEYRKDRAKERIAADRESRIAKTRERSVVAAAKVNRGLAQQLLRKKETAKGKKGATSAAVAASVLEDDRFSAMFSNPDFSVREDDERFQHLNPSGVAEAGKREEESDDSDAEYLEQFDAVDDDDGAGRASSLNSSDDESDSESDAGSAEEDPSRGSGRPAPERGIAKPKTKKRPRMYELSQTAEVLGSKAGTGARRGQPGLNKKIRESVPLGDRVNVAGKPEGAKRGGDAKRGGREMMGGRKRK